MDTFKFGFAKCKKKVAKAFLALDLSGITDLEPKEEAKGEEEGREEANGEDETKAKLVGIKEVIGTSRWTLSRLLRKRQRIPRSRLRVFLVLLFYILAFLQAQPFM